MTDGGQETAMQNHYRSGWCWLRDGIGDQARIIETLGSDCGPFIRRGFELIPVDEMPLNLREMTAFHVRYPRGVNEQGGLEYRYRRELLERWDDVRADVDLFLGFLVPDRFVHDGEVYRTDLEARMAMVFAGEKAAEDGSFLYLVGGGSVRKGTLEIKEIAALVGRHVERQQRILSEIDKELSPITGFEVVVGTGLSVWTDEQEAALNSFASFNAVLDAVDEVDSVVYEPFQPGDPIDQDVPPDSDG